MIILGGTSGIGSFLSNSLVLRGAIVICLSRNPPSSKWAIFAPPNFHQVTTNGLLFWAYLDLACMQTIFDFVKVFEKC